jgi:hypothetical protein
LLVCLLVLFCFVVVFVVVVVVLQHPHDTEPKRFEVHWQECN